MIEWYQNLYMDSIVADKTETYKHMAEDGLYHIPSLYCVAVAGNRNNLLDVISCNELRFSHYKRNKLNVVGLSTSYKEALELVKAIMMDVYSDTGGFNVRSYFGYIDD